MGTMMELGQITPPDSPLFRARTSPEQGPGADPLTGLADRRQMMSALELRLVQADARPAVLVIQLDRFRTLNDTLGHQIGDVALCRVAQRLRSAAGRNAMAVRLGGDRFAILLEQGAEATATADRVIDLVERPYAVSGHAFTLEVRIGTAVAPQDGTSAGALLQAAELGLQRAPFARHAEVAALPPTRQAGIALRKALEQDMRAALTKQQDELREAVLMEQFALYYQPQICARSGRLIGFEALMRWHHPTRGLVEPEDFMPLAQEVGLVDRLCAWALSTACREAALWPGLLVAVKISPSQLGRGAALAEAVARALAESRLDPECLEIEVTEAALGGDVGHTLSVLRQMGVGLAFEEFGTGASSLTLLGQHEFTRIRLDRSFVAALGGEISELAGLPAGWMVRAVAALGQGVGVATIADGVETMHQAERVREVGFRHIQGPFVSRPIPANAVPALIDRLGSAWSAFVP
jgi:diguanylate cyclase (GGDEF)-like protein